MYSRTSLHDESRTQRGWCTHAESHEGVPRYDSQVQLRRLVGERVFRVEPWTLRRITTLCAQCSLFVEVRRHCTMNYGRRDIRSFRHEFRQTVACSITLERYIIRIHYSYNPRTSWVVLITSMLLRRCLLWAVSCSMRSPLRPHRLFQAESGAGWARLQDARAVALVIGYS